jgi:protein tyrosine phosphatase (PTP) superfamily phosphohydrolase (DUF442 family)
MPQIEIADNTKPESYAAGTGTAQKCFDEVNESRSVAASLSLGIRSETAIKFPECGDFASLYGHNIVDASAHTVASDKGTASGAQNDEIRNYNDLTPQQIEASREKNLQSPKDNYNENANQYFAGIQNSFEVIPGVLYRGANPGGCNDESHPWTPESIMNGLHTLKNSGITTVVDFEIATDADPTIAAKIALEKADCAALGINFVSMPMDHQGPSPDQMTEFKNIVQEAQKDGGEVYGHCREGRDRTGYMVGAIRQQLQGWTVAQARAEDESHGYNAYKQQRYPELLIPDLSANIS